MTNPPHGIERQPIHYIVLAGNYPQFRKWLMDKHVSEDAALFVSNTQMLLGKRFPSTVEVVEVGTFNNREDADRIRQELKIRLQ